MVRPPGGKHPFTLALGGLSYPIQEEGPSSLEPGFLTCPRLPVDPSGISKTPICSKALGMILPALANMLVNYATPSFLDLTKVEPSV